MGEGFSLDVRYYRLSEAVEPFFTALYCFNIDCADGDYVEDHLHPEWSAMRFTERGAPPVAAIVPESLLPRSEFVCSGPTSRAIRFRLSGSRIWGLGLMPLGWAQFCRCPAGDVADQLVNGTTHEAFAAFRPLFEMVRENSGDRETTAEQIEDFLIALVEEAGPMDGQVLACQTALRDPELAGVEELAERLGISRRTLERLCARHFGFPPKTLLRRQRFLRSLARYMLEPDRNWSKALDGQYFDQAHFVHDFRKFMGLSPSEYAEMPHPILDSIIAHRMADHGAAPTTDLPTILRYQPAPQRAAAALKD